MLMRWEDLEVGDVLRWTEEAIWKLRNEAWFGHVDKDLNIIEVILNKNTIKFKFDKPSLIARNNNMCIYIKLDGKYKDITLFEIVKLKED